jgi:sugar transferase (PEP-CTERM system associated)
LRPLFAPGGSQRGAAFVLVEGLIVGGSLPAAVWLRLGSEDFFAYPGLLPKALLSAVVFLLCLYFGDLYEDLSPPRRLDLVLRVVQAGLVSALALALIYFGAPGLRVGRGILAIHVTLAVAGVLLWRHLCLAVWGHEALRETVLILGTGHMAQQIAREMLRRESLGYRILGFLGEHPSEVGRRLVNPSVIGTLADLPRLAEKEDVTSIVVALEDFRGRLPVAELMQCRMAGITVLEAASFFERLTGKILVKSLRPSWFVFSEGFNKPRLFRKAKRVFEFGIALVFLALVSPLLGLLTVLIRLESLGPVFYRQERVGEKGRPFTLFKLRSMRVDAEAATGPVWANANGDPRLTRLGGLLRALRLDEIPQLINVLKGEMSFVGPRPERAHFVEKLRTIIPFYDERHSVKPGITGWAQIKFGYGSNVEDAEEKLQYDLYYIKHMSLLFDLAIIFHTVKVMALGRGAR